MARLAACLVLSVLAGCNLVIDDERHLRGDGGTDSGSPGVDAGDTDAGGGPDGGTDAGGKLCGEVGVDPSCGPPDFAVCDPSMRCRTCFTDNLFTDIYYDSGGIRFPELVDPALAIVTDGVAVPVALVAWAVMDPAGIVTPVVSAIPLEVPLDGPIEQHLAPVPDDVGVPLDALEQVHALDIAPTGPLTREASLLVLGTTGTTRRVISATVGVDGPVPEILGQTELSASGTPFGRVVVTGRSVGDSANPLVGVWGEVDAEVGLRATGVEGAFTNTATLSGFSPAGDEVNLRGTGGRMMLVQQDPTRPASVWNSAASDLPGEWGPDLEGFANIAGSGDEYVLSLPNRQDVDLVGLDCDGSACARGGETTVVHDQPVERTAVAMVEGGVVLAAAVGQTLQVTALERRFRVVDPLGGERWYHEDISRPLLSLDMDTVRTGTATWVVVVALAGGGPGGDHVLIVRAMHQARGCPEPR